MRTCTRCEKPKRESAFAMRSDSPTGRVSICKKCHREVCKRHYRENKDAYSARRDQRREEIKAFFRELKDGKTCLDCKRPFRYYVLQFDHLDPNEKSDHVSKMLARGCSKERILKEIAKCELVCANCHAERTHGPLARNGL